MVKKLGRFVLFMTFLSLGEVLCPPLVLGDATPAGAKLTGDTTLILDPACNACEGVSMDLKVLVTGAKLAPSDLTVTGLTNETSKELANVSVLLEGARCTSSNETEPDNAKKPNPAAAALPPDAKQPTRKTPASCGSGAVVTAQLKVKGILGTGKWQATIKNGDAEVGKVEIINPQVPLKIKLVTPDAANPKITATRGENASFTLQNDDTNGYLVTWTLSAGGKLFTPSPMPAHDKGDEKKNNAAAPEPLSATEKLPPSGTHEVFFKLPGDWFPGGLEGALKSETSDARLTLRLASATCPKDKGAGAPTVAYSLKLQLNRYSDNAQKVWSYIIVFLIVLFGGMCSLYVNFVFPDRTKRRELNSQLSDAQTKIAGLPVQLASRVRVLAGMERRSLWQKVKTLKWYEPTFEDLMARINSGLQTLNRRITAISCLGDYRLRFESPQSQDVPPSILAELERLFEATVEILNKLTLTEDDFKNAEKKLSSIDGLLSDWKQDIPTRGPQLQDKFKRLATTLIVPVAASQDSHLGRIRAQLTDLFDRLNVISATPTTIDGASFLDLDRLAFRLDLIANFVAACNLRDPKNYDDPTMAAFRDKLGDQLKRSGWPALRTAQNLTKQMGEKIFYQDIKEALTKGRVDIRIDRSDIWPYDPTRFYLEFNDPAFNTCAAREEWEPVWNFGHASDPAIGDPKAFLKENGWTVSHYFPESRTYNISVTFHHPNDGTLMKSPTEPVTIREDAHVHVFEGGKKKTIPFLQDTRAAKLIRKGWQNLPSLFELLLVLLPAILGLIAGAKDQLLKMDLLPALVAMWLIGFQSDQIKNLLSQNKKS